MKYCTECGALLTIKIGKEIIGKQFVCTACHRSYVASPRLAAACIVENEGRILLCQRNQASGYGAWGLPSGFLEASESASQGALREVLEEAGLMVELLRPYALLHVPSENVLQIVYLARPLGDTLIPGEESLDVRYFDETELPWEQLAMQSTREVLRQYFSEASEGELGFLYAEIVRFPG